MLVKVPAPHTAQFVGLPVTADNPAVLRVSDVHDLGNVLEQPLTFFFSHKVESMDLLRHLLSLTGACHLSCSTYAISQRMLNFLDKLKVQGALLSFSLIMDEKIRQSQPDIMQHARQLADHLVITDCHAKIWLLSNQQVELVVVSSINLNHNPRQEAGFIASLPPVVQFYKILLHGFFNR
jgi:hypothetical protein